jgi:hypothetical protein
MRPLSEMETQYGTIENYFAEGLGIDADGQQTLRAVYLGRHRSFKAVVFFLSGVNHHENWFWHPG